ncbi:hypothetical protein [Streptomyces griseoaurantiacus]|uniref:hypothetical protein n=1 Tax=Streptomyces griseoaurantiacus TaxID=68213 RepID=UPI002E2CE688|nr:hypothetical protein [Streptomyces jietaisiensis]
MSDTMAARLMTMMRGNRPAETRDLDEMPDSTSVKLMRQARGDTDYSHVHEANRQGQAEYDAAVRKRASELRAQGVAHPEGTARIELQMAAQKRSEQADRRAVYEAMTANNRAEMEANSTPALRERVKAATTERRERTLSKLEASVLAALRAERTSA